jgi:hypothetical protein
MATCSNCKRSLSCGCQKRTASDGTSVCSDCLGQYESSLTQKQNQATEPQLNTWGKDRYKQLNKFIK